MYWGDDGRYVRATPRWRLSLVTGPTLEPIALAEAKLHLRFRHTDEDALVLDWIRAATRKVEHDTEMALLTQTLDLTVSGFPDYSTSLLTLPIRPVQSITHVKYYDALGVLQTLATSNYVFDATTLGIGLAVNGAWPSDLRLFSPGTVRFVAGYTSPDLVPEDLKQAVRYLVAHFDAYREPALPDRALAIDLGYEALIAPYVRHLAA